MHALLYKEVLRPASNNLHDELTADFMGICEAFGHYEAKLFQCFMGIDGNAVGRLMLYTARLPQDVREQIARTARRCSQYLEEFSESEPFIFSEQTRAASLIQCRLTA